MFVREINNKNQINGEVSLTCFKLCFHASLSHETQGYNFLK